MPQNLAGPGRISAVICPVAQLNSTSIGQPRLLQIYNAHKSTPFLTERLLQYMKMPGKERTEKRG